MFEHNAVAGTGPRRTTDTRHLLPPPQFSQLHAELGVRLARVAEVHDVLETAREELADAIIRSQEAATTLRRIQDAPPGNQTERAERQAERGRAIARTSMLRLHVRRLEVELQDAIRIVDELSDVQARIAASGAP